MKHLCCTDNLPSLFALILHDLLLLCSLLLSHPLLLTYLLLLHPYLLKLLFLLYPLLFSTFLLTLTFHLHHNSSITSSAVLNLLRAEPVPDEAKSSLTEQLCAMVFADPQFVSFSQHCGLVEDSKAKEDIRADRSRRTSEILQKNGSLRKEKEWKRTLACKLFEERMSYKLCEERRVVEGAEDMDLLWEAYEADADKTEKQRRKEKGAQDEEEEDDAEEGISGQLCCLRALKLSAGKMNLGVGRPSLVKISMALKGMAVFRRTGRRRKITG